MTLHVKRNKTGGTLADVVQNLATRIRNEGSGFADATVGNMVVSAESLNDAQFADFQHTVTSMETIISDAYAHELGDEAGKLTKAQKAAGAICAMAFGNPVAYAKAATSNLVVASMEGIRVVDPMMSGVGGQHDFRTMASMEAFDEQELKAHLPFSIAFNVQAARQDEFSETFYPTVVVTPDQAGLDVVVRRIIVMNETRHTLAGETSDFNRKNLVDAVIDHTILASESVQAVPVYVSGNADNIANFVLAATIAPVAYTVDGQTFQTSPLKIGKEMNILGLSLHPGLAAAGVMDNTDSLDTRMHLKKVYVSVKGGQGDGLAGSNADLTSVIGLSVERLPYSAFTKKVEGNYREMVLNFLTKEVSLNAATPAVNGALLGAAGQAGAAYFAGGNASNYVKLKIELTGRSNVEFGNVVVNSVAVAVDSVWVKNVDGTFSLAANQAAAVAAAQAEFIDLTVLGYDLFATRSNQNRRVRGLLVDTTEQVERHSVMMGAPITILSPVTSNRDASDLTGAVTAARIRNSNQAVTTLLNYADSLEGMVFNRDRSLPIPEIEGAGRWLVRAFYERKQLDLSTQINSVKSHERAADVSAAIVNAIRDVAYRMYRDSGYQAALDAMTGGTAEKPLLVIGTDPVTARHLQISGDTRLAGVALDYKIVVSQDQRVYGQVFLTFVRPNQTGPDPLTFGTHVWIPELAATVQVSRGGSTVKEAQVQPRNRHINNLPVLAVIEVQNLSEAVTEKVAIDFNDVTIP